MLAVVFPAVSRLSKRKMLWLSILLVTSMWPLQADKKKKERRLALFSYVPALFVIAKQKPMCCAFAMGLECTHFCLFAGISEWPRCVGCAPCDHFVCTFVSAEVRCARKVPHMGVLEAHEHEKM